MKGLEDYAEERSSLNEQNNFERELVKEDITNNSSKLLQTVKDLKTKMETIMKENQIILRAQEELNQILLEKINNKEKNKQIEYDNMSYQHKSKRSKYSKIESSSSSEFKGNSHIKKHQYSSDSSEINYRSRKKKYKPYEEISGEFKKIKPPNFNGKTEKERIAEAWLSGMKKYFHIYNYSNQIKERMAIYNLTGKANIWWQDIKVKGIKNKNIKWSTFKN